MSLTSQPKRGRPKLHSRECSRDIARKFAAAASEGKLSQREYAKNLRISTRTLRRYLADLNNEAKMERPFTMNWIN